MNIRLNGQSHEIAHPLTVTELLEQLGFSGKPCVVELDERAIFPREYDAVQLRDGSRVEVVTLAAGG